MRVNVKETALGICVHNAGKKSSHESSCGVSLAQTQMFSAAEMQVIVDAMIQEALGQTQGWSGIKRKFVASTTGKVQKHL